MLSFLDQNKRIENKRNNSSAIFSQGTYYPKKSDSNLNIQNRFLKMFWGETGATMITSSENE